MSASAQRKVRVAAVQMVSTPDVATNCCEADRLIAEAAAGGARLVVLPEYFGIVGMSDRDKLAVREKDGAGPLQDFLSQAASKHRVWLVGGSVPLEAGDDDKVRNTCLVYDDAGRVRRATTRFTCSASSAAANATTNPPLSSRVPRSSPSIRRGAGSAYPSVTMCASPSCIEPWAR